MKVYDVENWPNPERVRIALREKGVADQVTFIPVDVMGGEHRTEAFKKKNPTAVVPVLELDDGSFISESPAITEYIDFAFEGINLTGEGARNRAEVRMQDRKAESGVLDAAGAYFHHATDGLGPDLETYQNKDWGMKQGEKCLANLEAFNALLADREFVAGDSFSVADITLFCGLGFTEFAGLTIDPALTHLLAWRARIAARPSIAA